jgi:hypothetical protein
MRRATSRAIAATAFLAAALTPSIVTQAPASAHAPCGFNVADRDSSPPVRATRSGVNLRTGSSTSCPSRAQINPGHLLDYHCWTGGNDGYTWTFLEVNGRQGWVRDNLLPNNGSAISCAS